MFTVQSAGVGIVLWSLKKLSLDKNMEIKLIFCGGPELFINFLVHLGH